MSWPRAGPWRKSFGSEPSTFPQEGFVINRLLGSLALAAVLVVPGPILAQGPGDGPSLGLFASLALFREDGRVDPDRLRPGVTLQARLHFFRFLHGELAFSYVMTHRPDEAVCMFGFDCSALNRELGAMHLFSGSIGVTLPGEGWRPYAGIGRGHTWDSPYEDRTSWHGPSWVWYFGLEKVIHRRLGLHAEYRGSETDPEGPVHLMNHQVATGINIRLR